jgi:hypothetical protein
MQKYAVTLRPPFGMCVKHGAPEGGTSGPYCLVAALNSTTSSAGTRPRSLTSMPCALAHPRNLGAVHSAARPSASAPCWPTRTASRPPRRIHLARQRIPQRLGMLGVQVDISWPVRRVCVLIGGCRVARCRAGLPPEGTGSSRTAAPCRCRCRTPGPGTAARQSPLPSVPAFSPGRPARPALACEQGPPGEPGGCGRNWPACSKHSERPLRYPVPGVRLTRGLNRDHRERTSRAVPPPISRRYGAARSGIGG